MGRRVYDVVRLIRICTGRDAATFTVRAVIRAGVNHGAGVGSDAPSDLLRCPDTLRIHLFQ